MTGPHYPLWESRCVCGKTIVAGTCSKCGRFTRDHEGEPQKLCFSCWMDEELSGMVRDLIANEDRIITNDKDCP